MIITIYIYIYTPINWIKILQVIEIWFSCVLDHKNQAPQLAPDSGTTREPGSDWLHGMGFGKPWDFFQDLFHRFHLKMIAKTGLDFGGFFECLRGRSSRTCGCYSIQRAACKKKTVIQLIGNNAACLDELGYDQKKVHRETPSYGWSKVSSTWSRVE